MPFEIREMRPDDYPAVIALWRSSEGIGLSDADSPEGIARYLARNPGLSFVALEQDPADMPQLLGALLCGQDGRRGYRANGVGETTWQSTRSTAAGASAKPWSSAACRP